MSYAERIQALKKLASKARDANSTKPFDAAAEELIAGDAKLREAWSRVAYEIAKRLSETSMNYNYARHNIADKVREARKRVNRERRAQGLSSLFAFITTYCVGSICEFAPPEEMRPLLDDMERIAGCMGKYQIMMSRGFGKTTFVSALGAYRIARGDSHFVEIVAQTDGKGKDIFNTLTAVFSSRAFGEDFPELAVAFAETRGNHLRMAQTHCDGTPIDMEMKDGRLVLPTIEGSPCSGAKIVVKGFAAKDLRGLNIKGTRPDLIILDDIQTDEMAKNAERVIEALKKINGTIARQFTARKGGTMLMTATPICTGDVAGRIKDDPGWITKTYPMMLAMPVNMALWEDYRTVYHGEIAALATGAAPKQTANEFYSDHRAELDEGAQPFSPHNYTRGKELSAVQHAMNIIYGSEDGLDVFRTECQMEPRRAASVYDLTFRNVLANINGFALWRLPPRCQNYVVATVDVMSEAGLRWCVTAFGVGNAAAVVAYGRYPETGRVYPEKCSAEVRDASMAAAVRTLFFMLADAKVFTESGEARGIDAVGIDAGWQTATVTAVAEAMSRKFPRGIICLKGVPWDKFEPWTRSGKMKAEVQSADEWAMKLKSKYGGFHVGFHSDFWRETAQRAWFAGPLTDGSISIFGERADQHFDFANECVADQLASKDMLRSGKPTWKWRLMGANHMGDCVTMAFAMAYWQRAYIVGGKVAQTANEVAAAVAEAKPVAVKTPVKPVTPPRRANRFMSLHF